MPRSPHVLDQNAATTSIEGSLGVKGQLRVRSYGTVKHAHVVLRKVDEEAYVDGQGRKRTRAIFSLFAHKLINVKPGKELFMFLHPVSGDLQERVVALEADISNTNEMDADTGNSAKSDETVVQKEQTLPPKLRKTWSRKPLIPVKPEGVNSEKFSVGVQVQPTTTCAEVQAQPLSASVEIQAHPSSSSVQVQARPNLKSIQVQAWPSSSSVEVQAHPLSSSIEIQASACLASSGAQTQVAMQSDATMQTSDNYPRIGIEPRIESCTSTSAYRTSSPVPMMNIKTQDMKRISTTIGSSDRSADSHAHQRSLSPMELDSELELESVPTSPVYSPDLLVIELPSDDEAEPHKSITLQEPDDDPHIVSAVTLVGSPPFSSPPAPPAYPISSLAKASRAPTFVPAFHGPFPVQIPTQTDTLASDSKLSSTQRSSLVSTAASQILYERAHASPTITSSSFPSHATPLTSIASPSPRVHAISTAPSSLTSVSWTLPAAPAALRGGLRPAPTFVPATRLSQDPLPKLQAQDRPARTPIPLSSTPPLPTLASEQRGNKRTCPSTQPPYVSGAEAGMPASKKWKPIVKLEPLSPILSHSHTAEPVPVLVGDSSSSSNRAVFPPTTVTKQKDPAGSYGSVIVKVEALEDVCLGPPPVTNFARKPWPLPIVIDLTQSQKQIRRPPTIELTLPLKPSHATASRSGPKTRARANGQAQSITELFAIRTMQIKMGGSGRDAGVRGIVFSPSGALFAVVCRDSTVRIWDNMTYTEIAKLTHNASVISVVWLDNDTSIASMGSNGVVSKWMVMSENRWEWAKLVDSGDGDPSCLAYHRSKLAVANPRKGIKIWELDDDGCWHALDRNVPRKDVVTIRFINDGHDLLCGSSDGTVFRCTVPKCRVQPVTTFKTKVFHVDADPFNRFALIAQACGRAHLLELMPMSADDRDIGRVKQDFALREAEAEYGARATHPFGALFAGDDAVVFGAINGRVLVWDRKRGKVQHEMNHGSDILVQAVACFDGKRGFIYVPLFYSGINHQHESSHNRDRTCFPDEILRKILSEFALEDAALYTPDWEASHPFFVRCADEHLAKPKRHDVNICAKVSLSLVSKLFHSLEKEFLYQFVWIRDARQLHAFGDALARSSGLSTTIARYTRRMDITLIDEPIHGRTGAQYTNRERYIRFSFGEHPFGDMVSAEFPPLHVLSLRFAPKTSLAPLLNSIATNIRVLDISNVSLFSDVNRTNIIKLPQLHTVKGAVDIILRALQHTRLPMLTIVIAEMHKDKNFSDVRDVTNEFFERIGHQITTFVCCSEDILVDLMPNLHELTFHMMNSWLLTSRTRIIGSIVHIGIIGVLFPTLNMTAKAIESCEKILADHRLNAFPTLKVVRLLAESLSISIRRIQRTRAGPLDEFEATGLSLLDYQNKAV